MRTVERFLRVIVCLAAVFQAHAAAQPPSPTLTTIYSFTGENGDGRSPYGTLVIGTDGALYGTTWSGGSANLGTVFQLTPPATAGQPWSETILHSFTGSPSDGSLPPAGVALGTNGELYGVTYLGGPSNEGNVFQLTPPASAAGAWTETALRSFAAPYYGTDPDALVAGSHGELYGSTLNGGSPHLGADGAIFLLTPPSSPGGAWNYSVVHRFPGSPDGLHPGGGLAVSSEGVIYGTTVNGGSAASGCQGLGCGAVFELRPPATSGAAWRETVLYSFSGGPDGANPEAGVVLGAHGVLYGTSFGYHQPGNVFSLTPPATPGGPWSYQVLYTFTGWPYGAGPLGMVQSGNHGALVGVTTSGGADNHGAIFQLTPPATPGGTWSEKILYSFTGGSDGHTPVQNLTLGPGGDLYGITQAGGIPNAICHGYQLTGCGTVFKLTF